MPPFASTITFPGFQPTQVLPSASVPTVQSAFEQMGGFLAMDSAAQLMATVGPVPAFVATQTQKYLFADGSHTEMKDGISMTTGGVGGIHESSVVLPNVHLDSEGKAIIFEIPSGLDIGEGEHRLIKIPSTATLELVFAAYVREFWGSNCSKFNVGRFKSATRESRQFVLVQGDRQTSTSLETLVYSYGKNIGLTSRARKQSLDIMLAQRIQQVISVILKDIPPIDCSNGIDAELARSKRLVSIFQQRLLDQEREIRSLKEERNRALESAPLEDVRTVGRVRDVLTEVSGSIADVEQALAESDNADLPAVLSSTRLLIEAAGGVLKEILEKTK